MKKRLLVFHPIIAPYRIDFFNALNYHFDTKVCLLWRNLKDQTFEYSMIEAQLEFSPCYLVRNELGFVKWIKAIWKELSKYKPDIVYVNEYGLLTILTLIHRFIIRSKYKIVTITDDSYNMIAYNNYFSLRHKYALKLLSPLLDEIQTVEPRVTDWYNKKTGKGIFFPIICDDDIANERQKRVLPISEQMVIDYQLEGKKVLLFVGRLVGLKNIEFAIKAFIKANIKDSAFIIVGSGEEESYLRKIAEPYPNVKLVGRFEGDELYAWYNIANVLTLQSTTEPFGAVTNEALVAGCMVLISQNAGSNCLVCDGENGYAINPDCEEDYIEKLCRLMDLCQQVNLPLCLRPSKMNTTFQECIERLSKRL